MFKITETPKQANTVLKIEYMPLRCKLEATFYPETQQLGTWIGGGDDWSEDFELCSSIGEAQNLLINRMMHFMTKAEADL